MFWELMVGLLTGILSGFGVGGGSLLMLYLTMFAGVQQYAAGGINLLYFIACAPAALWSHVKNGLVERPAVLWCTLAGLPGVLLLYIGVRELRAGRKKGTETQEKAPSDL